ncbi:flagellar motor protein MotB [Merismopedia glauca CCAP 1448/3]|uniref:Flagellar motor protein MotB n=2 Tax=Merismopedia TaxID=53402 RepID=A0A2T1BXF1_9CYAN|nr:flagellar motor protein MotB [Merismopedia glauca CCAP 1448/3]
MWFWLNRLEEKISHLRLQIEESKAPTLKDRELLSALVPLVDEAIRQRSQSERSKMAAAIGQILPTAIAHEIEQSPTNIAKAIAPELALAIQEQIELDSVAISTVLGPQMGDAIKTQITVERDAMVDALYPVIGNTISKYMVELVKSINDKVESTLSPEGLLRKIRAKLQGVSEAELILQEALGYKIQAVLLIHKASGLVIRELQPSPDFSIEANMLAGMLTAIRSFVNECMAQPDLDSELHEIEYNASKILLEVAGYCYLAVIVKGEPSPAFIAKIRETLSEIVLKSEKAIANYDGDPTTIPKTIDLCFDSLIQAQPKLKRKPWVSRFPAGLFLIVLPLCFIWYRGYIAGQIEAKTAEALDGVPELSIYRIVSQVHQGKLTLTGRLPNEYLRQKAEAIAHQVAPNWTVTNQIVAVDVPAEPIRTAGEVERVTWIYNQKKGVAIATRHDFGSNSVNVTGVVTEIPDVEQLTAALKQIPGITTVISTVQIRPVLETRLYFDLNSSEIRSSENTSKLKLIRQFLDLNPGVHLKIIAHSDSTGESNHNQQLSLQRARSVQQTLIAEGVNPARLQIQASHTPPPDVTPQQPLWLSRSVRFEVFIPSTRPN